MDLTYTAAQDRLRRDLPRWLARNLPRTERSARSVEYGGQGADLMDEIIIADELVRAQAPGLLGLLGVEMVGPTLIQ